MFQNVFAMAGLCGLVLGLLGTGSTRAEGLPGIAEAVQASIARGELPGAVVGVWHKDRMLAREAFGQRALKPAPEAMTLDTVFDLASLTKPIATATSVMKLIEEGKLRLDERVASYWPEFGTQGKERLTLEHLLTHTSGLIADNPIKDYAEGPAAALRKICELKPLAEPGQRFIYSDVNFIVLGELVGRVSGKPLDEYARLAIFEPLGMRDTGFRPAEALKPRCAPTEQREGHWMRGEVHDPRAHALGNVAGHAGLFSTVEDLTRYARMILAEGKAQNGTVILKPETVRLMTAPRPVPGGQRGLGWDIDTGFSRNRGEFFPRGRSFGHTGFTGTSLWIDPPSQTAVIFLSNRVHPDGKGNVNRVRNEVATLAARAAGYARETAPSALAAGVLTGIDVLVEEKFARLRGRKIGLVTNHTGRDRLGRATIDLLHEYPQVQLVALFSPEHGIRGALDENVKDGKDEKTGLPVYSLYGPRRKPTAELLKGVDVLVYDIQDIGCRFYTYISTLGLVMEAAAENKIPLVVLDRPNPIGGVATAGPILDPGQESFVAWHSIPLRHGMTVGELARLFRAERKIDCQLDVVTVRGWKRSDFYDRTLLPWVNPSPNMRNLAQALLYPGIGLLETTNVSVGRGTDQPFEWIGAPWIDGPRLAEALAARKLPGVRFVPTRRTPSSSTHAGKECGGVQMHVDDWAAFEPVRTGLTLASEIRRLFPNDWSIERYNRLLGHAKTLEGLKNGRSAADLEADWQAELNRFRERRQAYLLYP